MLKKEASDSTKGGLEDGDGRNRSLLQGSGSFPLVFIALLATESQIMSNRANLAMETIKEDLKNSFPISSERVYTEVPVGIYP